MAARASIDRLHHMIERHYQDMTSRVELLESGGLQTLAEFQTDSDIQGDDFSIMTVKDGPLPTSQVASSLPAEITSREFAETLERSWVYRRSNALDASRLSIYSKDHCSMAWSSLTGVSWAEVSNISVIGLPIMFDEVYNHSRSRQTWSGNRTDPRDLVGGREEFHNETLGGHLPFNLPDAESFKCVYEDCSGEFNQRDHLINHIRVVHRDGAYFGCPHYRCSKIYSGPDDLINHLMKIHRRIIHQA